MATRRTPARRTTKADLPARPTPEFEGQTVDEMRVRIQGTIPFDTDATGAPVSINDILEIKVDYRVEGVMHIRDKGGKLVREHVLRPIRVSGVTWHSANGKF